MDYEPDWKSKLLVTLFGKKRLLTLLDATQLMFKQDFKNTSAYQNISSQIIYSAVGANIFVLLTSLLFSRKFFNKCKILSLPKLLTDCGIIFASYYTAAIYLSQSIKQPVHSAKAPYLRCFDPDFLFHFNLLAAKYQIQEQLQTQNIFNQEELAQWISCSISKISQTKEV